MNDIDSGMNPCASRTAPRPAAMADTPGQLAEAEPGGDLPGGGGTDEHRIARIGHRGARCWRQCAIARESPKEGVGIQQEVQTGGSQAASLSSGKGSKNPGPAEMIPR